jgi:hypothetical protein
MLGIQQDITSQPYHSSPEDMEATPVKVRDMIGSGLYVNPTWASPKRIHMYDAPAGDEAYWSFLRSAERYIIAY